MGQAGRLTPSREIVDREVDRLLRDVVRIRTFGAPILVVAVATLACLDDTSWRRWTLLGVLVAAIVLGTVTSRRAERGVWRQELRASVVGVAPLQLLVVGATGGIDSPLIVLLPPYMVVTSVLVGQGRWLAAMLVGKLTVLGGLATLQATSLAPFLDMPVWGAASPAYRVGAGLAIIAVLGVSAAAGLTIRQRIQSMVGEAIRDRDEQLQTLVSQSRELEHAAAELAHELKNPLASIHGLSSLLARERTTPQNQERMEVLRGEVQRMRETLDEFLTYSRPMTPLSRADLDGRELLERVRALHEGLADTHGVHIVIDADPTPLRGDPRKLGQAL
ncbi:MAG: HAMP domain-containing sensor histidine kinase, partial [Myxococcota bacterium]